MKTSNYEEKVIQLLKQANIKFQREKTFSDLKGGSLRYDFYLPALNACIEVDGEQHFKQIARFQKTRTDLLKQKERDRIKNSYCLAHNISLYRIPYWEINNLTIPTLLFQSKFKVTTKWWNDIIWQNYCSKNFQI